MIGSPKKPNPMKNVVIFMKIYEEVTKEMSRPGRMSPATFSLGACLGNGEVGDNALIRYERAMPHPR